MQIRETAHLECGDCQAVFDLHLRDIREREETDDAELIDFGPTICPFCGAEELIPIDPKVRRGPKKK